MRPAITLFITLAIVAAMIALVGITFSYLTEARTKAQDKSALIEANLIYADVSAAVEKFVGKKPSRSTLQNIYKIPINIQEQKGPFSLIAACAPARAAVPITWFKTKGGAKAQDRLDIASRVLEAVSLKYRIKDAQKLQELISRALDSKYENYFGYEGRLYSRNNYLSWSKFKAILNTYALSEDDDTVYKVNWKQYFSFGEGYNQIDGDFLSANLIEVIFGIDRQIAQEDFKNNLKKFLYDNGADMALYNSKLFAKEAVVAMQCSASYTFGKGNYSLKFKYINGKVEDFEFIR